MNKKYKYLTPLILFIPGVWMFFEWLRGWMDSRKNQVCQFKEGHTTPLIITKVDNYCSHINKIYIRTIKDITPLIKQANSLLVEFYQLMEPSSPNEKGNDEETMRRVSNLARNKTNILKSLTLIKSELDMVNQMLLHFEERAQNYLNARIERYWRGVLASSHGKVKHSPCIEIAGLKSRDEYNLIRTKLVDEIERILNTEGGGQSVQEATEAEN